MSDPPPDILHIVRQWLRYAEEDLRNAEHTLTMGEDCPYSTVCFHAQQVTEKYIKALLILHSINFPRTHDIGELVALLPTDIGFSATAEEKQELTDHATVSRYPGDWEPLSRTEAVKAVSLARKIRVEIQAHLPRAAMEL